MEENDDAQCLTVTVALELDDGAPEIVPPAGTVYTAALPATTLSSSVADNAEPSAESINSFAQIGPRTLPAEACPRLSDASLRLRDLNAEAMRLLELRLNPYAIGTLKNWEFVCAELGASIDEIANLRSAASPTVKMLQMFRNVHLKNFLDVLCAMNRVDVLISIAKFVENLKPSAMGSTVDDRRYSQTETEALLSKSLKSCQLNNTDYILLLHHETSKEARKYFKYMRKNLRHQCKISNGQLTGKDPGSRRIECVDVNDCMDEFNIYETVQQKFDNARSVVVVFNVDYLREVVGYDVEQSKNFGNNVKESLLSLKIFLHRLTNNEYIRNEMRNRRFRAVLMPGTERAALPNGWPSNTLVYSFPDDYAQLCKKLFDISNIQMTPNTTDTTTIATFSDSIQR